jgi:hypothetical protein
LSRDALRPDARKDAYRQLFAVLDGLAAKHKSEVEAAARRYWRFQAKRSSPVYSQAR